MPIESKNACSLPHGTSQEIPVLRQLGPSEMKPFNLDRPILLENALPDNCRSSRRFLGHHEKISLIGQELNVDRAQSSESHSRKLQMTSQPAAMSYNHAQHEISEAQRVMTGLNRNFVTRTDYDKLCMSFLSGLPNEQELALNVCTILSNEGNYMLHLEKSPKLVNLLLSQAGVWPTGDSGLKEIYLEGWEGVKGRNMRRFWRSTINVKYPKLLELCDWYLGDDDEDEKFLNLEFDLGTLNIEGQRVLRIALILHNLSFEKNNVPVLVGNSNFLRFLLLCMHSTWSDLKQTAYDTMGNLASAIQLSIEKNTTLKLLFQTLMDGIQSSDRFLVIRSLDILSQLCGCELNEDIIPSKIDIEVYELMVSFLTVPDIMLLFFTLEALYALSDLGRYACDKIVNVHRSVGALVSLLTLDPNQYGASAQIRVKVVETLVPAEPEPAPKEIPASSIVASSTVVSTTAATCVATNTVTATDDSEAFVCSWLKQAYECAPGSSVARNDVYADYVSHCSKSGKRGVVNANIFASCVKGVYPQCGLKKVESNKGIISFHYDGLQKKSVAASQTNTLLSMPLNCFSPSKNVPVPVSSVLSSDASGLKASHSPILKAQLSAPPKPGIISQQLKQPMQATASVPKPVSPSPSPCYTSTNNSAALNTGSSTLIKSLLANKVQQRNIQRSIHVQPNVRKMVIYTPEKAGCVRTINASPGTVVRAIRPRPPQTCVTTPFARSFVQSGMIPNKARMVTTSPPRVLKTLPLLAPKVQTMKQIVNTSQPNGMVHNVQIQACVQQEEMKLLSPTDLKALSNHVPLDRTIADSNDSLYSDAESIKDVCFSSDSEQNSMLSLEDASLSSVVASSLSASNSMIVQSNSLSSELDSGEDKASNVTFVHNSSLLANSESESASLSTDDTFTPTFLKSVLGDTSESKCDMTSQIEKEKILKRAPLLNGLLDKGKSPLSIDNTLSVGQNASKSSAALGMNQESKKTSNIAALNSTVAPSPFTSNGDGLVQICSGPTTLSGTIEVQPDQKGVVRLHIESPENSNQGSDLSSISDITRTLECASKAISQTNAECSSNVPFTCTCGTTATVTVITSNPPTLARTGQQIIVVTPALSQPQLRIQSPNIKFKILHSIPKADDSVNLIGFPRVSLNQLNLIRQTTTVETPSVSAITVKRPSSEDQNLTVCSEAKKPRLDAKTPLSEAAVTLPTPVPSPVVANSINAKPFHDNQSSLPKSAGQMETSPSTLTAAKAVAVPVQNIEAPNEREAETFSGLSSAGDTTTVVTTSIPSKPTSSSSSSSKLEYVCEWKDCNQIFTSPGAVLVHAGKSHVPFSNEDLTCHWGGCDSMKRRCFSLLTHLQEWHCNEKVLNVQAMRRKQLSQQGKTTIAALQMPPPHPGYAPDAAILAIRRHALQYLNPKELSEEDESALAKSIRLTSALILRNLVTHSSLARSYLRCYEPELAYLAMSPVESSRTIAQCLSELARSHE